jgi:hypothetical protein
MDSWQPVTLKELESLIAAQLADCSPDQQQLFERCKVAPRLTPIDRGGNIESVFVVAQARDLVMYYEDVENGFNISPLSPNGAIASPGYEQWELRHALRHLVAA